MTQSPEYPDLLWMQPKSWTDANRSAVQLIIIHTTEGSARGESAEDGASYDQRRTDGTSTHFFHDSNSTVQCVRTADQAHAARAQGNRRGIQHELCTRAGSANWADAYHSAMLRRAAKQAARDAKKWNIPVRHLTVAQVADGAKGFCGHWDVTRAFPQDNGTHTDPGSGFPWTAFLDMVRDQLSTEDDVATFDADDRKFLTDLLAPLKSTDYTVNPIAKIMIPDYSQDATKRRLLPLSTWIGYTDGNRNALQAALSARFDQLSALLNAFIAAEGKDDATKAQALAAIQAAVTSSAAVIAAAVVSSLPEGGEVTQEMVDRAMENALREAFGTPSAGA
jgi:N-acetyl-anhydromuramyl-L-alanine amidase AmpD